MPGTMVAKRYAKALLGLAQEQQVAESVGSELTQVAEVLAEPTLARVLALPTLPVQACRDIVEQLIRTLSPQPLVSTFLRVLAENGRLNILADIAEAYQRLLEHALGRVRTKVCSAAPLSEAEAQAVVDAFGRLTQKTVVPTFELDPELLGGIVVEIEGRVYDASFKTQLRRLGESLARQL